MEDTVKIIEMLPEHALFYGRTAQGRYEYRIYQLVTIDY